MSQQVEIAASHQFKSGTRQTNGAVAEFMGLPAGTGGNACASEEALCNDAVAIAGQAAVERAKGEHEPVTSLPRQPLQPATA